MMDSAKLKEAITSVLRETPQRPFLCLPMSAFLYAILKDNFNMNARLATGDLQYNGNYVFKQDFSISTAKDGEFQEWSGHAWVELHDIICDLSFLRTLHSPQFNRPFRQELVNSCGQRTGALILSKDTPNSIGLQYKRVEFLSDDLATGILKGYESLLKK